VSNLGGAFNCVCPGLVDTAVMRRNIDPARLSAPVSTIRPGRLAAPAEIASTICFLASDASSYFTSAIVDVTGGLR
jgi:3-oxoacyl-[acyl-carrier protein] reductase